MKLLIKFGMCAGLCLLLACSQAKSEQDIRVTITSTIDDDCVDDKFKYLGLDADTFENDRAKGWRHVADNDECVLSAAALLNEYRTIILADQADGMMWHEAQLRASAGQTEAAIQLFSQTRQNSPVSNQHYRDATLAFLRQDLSALKTARTALASVPMPDGFAKGVADFKQRFPDAPAPTWPMNLDVVDGFITCFDQPYKQAYSTKCRPK